MDYSVPFFVRLHSWFSALDTSAQPTVSSRLCHTFARALRCDHCPPPPARPPSETLREYGHVNLLLVLHPPLPAPTPSSPRHLRSCRAQLAKQYKGKVVFTKVDVNANRETSGAQMIRSMPTFQFYLNGKKKHQFSGKWRCQRTDPPAWRSCRYASRLQFLC